MGDTPAPGVSPEILQANRAVSMQLPFEDRDDFEDALRGRLGSLTDGVIAGTDGRVVWDPDAYDFLDGEPPATVNPSLWRQARLNTIHGLFEVTDGHLPGAGLRPFEHHLHRGRPRRTRDRPADLRRARGRRAGADREHRGDKPVTAVIYTHSHVDHFGGVARRARPRRTRRGPVQIVAPEGFLEHAVSENVLLGNAMTRRATYMYGALLPRGPGGQVDAGLGKTVSLGTVSLVPADRRDHRDRPARRRSTASRSFSRSRPAPRRRRR